MAIFSKYRFLSDLLDSLAADGFDMGTGKHLQVQELLSKLPDDLPLEALKTLLGPIFATNRQDQERFYELFEISIKRERVAEATFATKTVKKSKTTEVWEMNVWRNAVLLLLLFLAGWVGYLFELDLFRWWWNPTFLLSVLLAGAAGYLSITTLQGWWKRAGYWVLLSLIAVGGHFIKRGFIPPLQPRTEYVEFQVTPGSTNTLPIPLEKDKLLSIQFCNGQTTDTSEILGTLSLDSIGNFTLIAKDSFARSLEDTVCVVSFYEKIRDTTYFIARYEAPPSDNEPEDVLAKLDTLPIPFPKDISSLWLDAEQQAKAEFYQRNAWWMKILLSFLFGAILWSIVKWNDKKRRRLVAELEQREKPPYVWSIKMDQAEELIFGDSVRILLNQLRRRRLGEGFRLDVAGTVNATVRSAGRVDFKFKQLTAPPDYLLLIERNSYSDHRAMLFNCLYESFRANEVNVERFYYNGDPRLCFNEANPSGINVKELQHRFGEARLLIVGNGYDLLSPMSGKIVKWATIFTNWRERALFSPQPLEKWGRREDTLGELFYLMPASIESFTATLDEFGSTEPRRPGELIVRLEDVQWRPIELDGDLIYTLRQHFSEKIVQWIAACAVYPTLHWDMTLYLGRELSNEREPLLSLENLLAITQVPWFVEGRIPDAAREDLLAYLEQIGLETQIRESIHRLFEQTPKPAADSVAYDEYRMNAASNELLFTTDRSRRQDLRVELNRYVEAGFEPDVVSFRYLNERQSSRLDLAVPDNWKERVFHAGKSLFGWKDWVWALPLWIVLTFGLVAYSPTFEVCLGERITYQEQELCMEQASDYLLYYEYLIRDRIARQDLSVADSLLQIVRSTYFSEMVVDSLATTNSTIVGTLLPIAADTASFLHNISIYYYNAGVGFYNQWVQFQDSINLIIQQESTIPQQQESNRIGSLNRLMIDQEWRIRVDSLAVLSCGNFTRGYNLYQRLPTDAPTAGQRTGYSFSLVMNRICPESPTTLPEAPTVASFAGKVVDARTGVPIINVRVDALNGNVTVLTDRDGNYTLEIPSSLQDSLVQLGFSKAGYAARTENIRMRAPLREVTLSQLEKKTEGVEIFESKGRKGLRTTSGKTIIAATYNNIERDPASGLYRVQIITKADVQMGYINEQGEVVIPVEYRLLGFLRDGLIVAAKERYGYLDRRGRVAIGLVFESANDFVKGEAEVSQRIEGQRYSFVINKNGICIRNCPPNPRLKEKGNLGPESMYLPIDQATTVRSGLSLGVQGITLVTGLTTSVEIEYYIVGPITGEVTIQEIYLIDNNQPDRRIPLIENIQQQQTFQKSAPRAIRIAPNSTWRDAAKVNLDNALSSSYKLIAVLQQGDRTQQIDLDFSLPLQKGK